MVFLTLLIVFQLKFKWLQIDFMPDKLVFISIDYIIKILKYISLHTDDSLTRQPCYTYIFRTFWYFAIPMSYVNCIRVCISIAWTATFTFKFMPGFSQFHIEICMNMRK